MISNYYMTRFFFSVEQNKMPNWHEEFRSDLFLFKDELFLNLIMSSNLNLNFVVIIINEISIKRFQNVM